MRWLIVFLLLSTAAFAVTTIISGGPSVFATSVQVYETAHAGDNSSSPVLPLAVIRRQDNNTGVSESLDFGMNWQGANPYMPARIIAIDHAGYGGLISFATKSADGDPNTDPTERLRIDNSGLVFVGASSDSGSGASLQVAGAGIQILGAVQPTCDASHRGEIQYTAAASGVKDTAAICAKDAVNAFAWRTIY